MPNSRPLKLLLTGPPGCGKTTAIRDVVRRLGDRAVLSGFWTEEVRAGGRRIGFDGVTTSGERFELARRTGQTPYVLGPYHVFVDGLEQVGLVALRPDPRVDLLVIDEIGKMEAFSDAFRERVETLLAGPCALLGTVAEHGVGWIKRVRQDPRVTLVGMTARSRGAIVGELLRRLHDGGIAQPDPSGGTA